LNSPEDNVLSLCSFIRARTPHPYLPLPTASVACSTPRNPSPADQSSFQCNPVGILCFLSHPGSSFMRKGGLWAFEIKLNMGRSTIDKFTPIAEYPRRFSLTEHFHKKVTPGFTVASLPGFEQLLRCVRLRQECCTLESNGGVIWPLEVIPLVAMIFTSGFIFRSARIAAVPSITGIMMSVITALIFFLFSAKAATPSRRHC